MKNWKKIFGNLFTKNVNNEEVAIIVETVIKDLNADSINDIGKIMPDSNEKR